MSRRSDASVAALLLTQRLVDADAQPLKASEYWRVVDAVGDLGTLLAGDAVVAATGAGLATALAERIAALLSAATAFAFALDEAEQGGMRVLASVDDDYPAALRDRLGAAAPPLLYAVGDPALLTNPMLGVVGSRDVDAAGGDVARRAAATSAAAGWGVVSGGARGVDRLAMQASLDAGGTFAGVLADSLAQTVRDAGVRRAVTDGQLCLCTPYKPSVAFSVANAMGRNKVIYALSRATLVVAADEGTGGTWGGAAEALRRSIAPVLAWTGDGAAPGNAALVTRGAVAVTDIERVVQVASTAASTAAADQRRDPDDSEQLQLGV